MRASHAAFVLKLLGYDDVALYDASFSEWGNLDETPIEKDGKITMGRPIPARKSPRKAVPKPARKAKKPSAKAMKVAKPARGKKTKASPARRKKPGK